ncbi:unnamed protein product [Parajaminaea phylloscopi]
MGLSPKLYTFGCGCFAALGSILFGYDLGVIAGVLIAKDFLNVTGHPDADYLGFITSSMLLGAFIATIPAALTADRFSRRSAIFVGALIFILGGVLQTAAMNRETMLAGRFFAGMGIGQLGMLAPLYQSEIAHPSRRGSLTTLVQLFLGIGALVASFVVYGCNKHHRDTIFEWRFPLALQLLPALPLAALIFLLPESPRWLVAAGRDEDALKSLARLHARGDVQDTFVLAQLAEIQATVSAAKQQEASWMRFVTDKQAFRKVLLGITIQFSVQMTGVSAIQYYSPQIFATMGFSSDKTLLLQSINSIVAICGEVACVLFIDKLGRRGPLITANMVAGSTFCVVAALQASFPNSGNNFNQSAAIAFVAMTWIFNLSFSSGIGPLSWAIPAEIFDTALRAKGTAITSMAAWISNFMIGQVTPRALENIGWRFYIVFAVCGFTNALTFFLVLPETKGRTLEEMDRYFAETPWIVLGAKTHKVSTSEREEQLRRGITTEGQLALGGPASPAYEKDKHSDDGLRVATLDQDVERQHH